MPIVEVAYPEQFADDEFHAYLAQLCALAEAHRPIAYIIDLRQFDPLGAPAKRRQLAAAAFNQCAPKLMATTVCEARIVTDRLTRGIVTAFDWFTGTKWPCATFVSELEANAWVTRHLLARDEAP
jgi:hypothetical protein